MPGKDAIRALREKGQKKAGFKMKATKISVPAPKHGDSIPRGAGSAASMFIKKEIIPKEFKAKKRLSYIGLGRTKKGRTPRSPGVPFERGSIGLRKKSRKSSRKPTRNSGR